MIHFDHAATGVPRLAAAIEAFTRAAELPSHGRGRHSGQTRTADAVAEARTRVAALVGSGTTVFTSGATHALNIAIAGLPAGRVTAVDPLAHDAVLLPLERRGGALWVMPHDEAGRIDPGRTAREWPTGVDWVVIGHGSNINGVLQPVGELTELARRRGACVLVDAAQTAGVVALADATAMADIVCFSSHKGLRSVPGSGALVLRRDLEIEPLVVGGTGEHEERSRGAPDALEAGTLNHPGAVAMGVAAHAFTPWPFREMAAALRDAVLGAGVAAVWSGELPTVSFVMSGLSPAFVEDALDRAFDIAVRSGRHCARLGHRTLATGELGTVRVSAGATTTDADLDALTRALRSIASALP